MNHYQRRQRKILKNFGAVGIWVKSHLTKIHELFACKLHIRKYFDLSFGYYT